MNQVTFPFPLLLLVGFGSYLITFFLILIASIRVSSKASSS